MQASVLIPLLLGGVVASGAGVFLTNRCSEISSAVRVSADLALVGIGLGPAFTMYAQHLGGNWPVVAAWGWVFATMVGAALASAVARALSRSRSAPPVTSTVLSEGISASSPRGRTARIDAAIGALTKQMEILSRETPPRAARRSEEPIDAHQNQKATKTATA